MTSTVVQESATQLFSKLISVSSSYTLEKNLFPNITSKDVIEIYGESGSGKTELLYHFIVQCILPLRWRDLNLDGLGYRVIFIDNDCRFNLFRLMTIFETRLKALQKDRKISSEEISLLISERIKFLEVAKCYDTQQFLITLCSLESLLALNDTKSVLMIDGITSFYLCDEMRMQTQHKKLPALYSKIYSVIKNISQNGKISVFTTRRRIMSKDKKVIGPTWKNIVTWHLKLTLEHSEPGKTIVTLINLTSAVTFRCMIGRFGFVILHQHVTL